MSYLNNSYGSFKTILKQLPKVVGVEAKRYSDLAFQKQAWDGTPWKPRKPRGNVVNRRSRKKSKRGDRTMYRFNKWVAQDANRALLVKGKGYNLKRSRRVIVSTNTVQLVSDKPYAQIHNEGGRVGRKKGGIMPKRQFFGFTRETENKVKAWMGGQMKGLFK